MRSGEIEDLYREWGDSMNAGMPSPEEVAAENLINALMEFYRGHND